MRNKRPLLIYQSALDQMDFNKVNVWSHIIIETLDAYMYSAAIICQADFFVTTDGALRDMTASLADQAGEYAAVAQQLHSELGLGSGVRFPRGVRLRHALN